MDGRSIAERIAQQLSSKYGEFLNPNLIYSQLAHETGGFTSSLATEHHNYGGLTQTTPNGLQQPDGSNYYMSFASDEDFADYMADYLYKYKENGLFNSFDAQSYAAALKNGGYFGDEVENYVNGMNRFLGQSGVSDFTMIANEAINPLQPVVQQEESEEATFEDKLNDAVYDSTIWGAFRTFAATKDLPDEAGFKVTQEDIDAVQKELDGDYTATLWVCQNAHSYEQLQKFTKMKKDDLERRKRIDESDIGLSTFGTVLGTLIDPMNYIPVLGATGKVGSMTRYMKMAAGAAIGNVVERGMAQSASGYEQNYPMAALMGAAAGGLLPLSLDLMGKGFGKVGEKLYNDAVDAMENAERMANGQRPTNMLLNASDFMDTLRKMNDATFADSLVNRDIAKTLDPEKGVFVLSLEDAKKIARERGIELSDKVKGIFDDDTGISIMIKDNLLNEDDILKTLLHEKGAHGLKFVLSEKEYQSVMDEIQYRANHNPSPAFRRAIHRAYDKGDPEEILGYLAEELKASNPLMRNIKKKLDKALNSTGVKGHMTDDDFLELLQQSAKQNLEGAQKGYRVLDDGGCTFKGFHYSEKSMLNMKYMDDAASLFTRGKNTLAKFFKRNYLFATPWTVCSTSLSPKLKEFGERVLANPYMQKVTKGVPVELKKTYIMQQTNRYFNNYHKIRDKAVVEKAPIRGKFSATMKEDFDRKVYDAYNAIYGKNVAGHLGEEFDPAVLEGVKTIKEMRDFIIDTMKNSHKIFGEGIQYLPYEWKNIDDELWRFIDNTKRAEFLKLFKNEEEAIDSLIEYAFKNAKRDVFRQRMEAESLEVWKKEVAKSKTKPPKPLPITDEDIESRISKEAYDWAKGIVDQNASNRYLAAGERMADYGNLEFMRHRFPMDTSAKMTLRNGVMFSFDDTLRSFDIDNTLPFMMNRFAGEIALSTLFGNQTVRRINALGELDSFKNNIKGLRGTIEEELKVAANKKLISNSQVNDELKTFDYIFNKLLGVTVDDEPKTRWEALAHCLKDYSYARNGIHMGLNQLSEISGTLAYEGLPALFDLIPSVGRMVDDARLGKGSSEMLQDALLDTFGENANRYIFLDTRSTRVKIWRNVGTGNGFDKAADAVASAVKTSSSFVSALNGLNKLTDNMIFSARKQMLIDTVKWVNNAIELPSYRNPFSKGKLEAAGISDSDAFKATMSKYLQLDKKGNLKGLDIKKFKQEEPMLFMKFYSLINNQAMRCITQDTIGNSNMFKESNPFWKIFFQFKDFTMRATHSQACRIASHREVDDILATVFSMATVMPVTVGLAYGRAYALYGNDSQKRKKYLDNYLATDALIRNSLLRSSVLGSPLSNANDISEAFGFSMSPTIRTTVSRYDKSNDNIFTNPERTLGSAITQLPAFDSALDIGITGANITRAALTDYDFSDRDFKRAMSLLPGQNCLLLLHLRKELASELHLSTKQK